MPKIGDPIVIIGAGPAGLTAAFDLAERGCPAVVLEKDALPGGLARTETYKGFRFDIGGHRFFTRNPEVERLWHGLLGRDFLLVERLSRIFYRNKFFHYPLDLANTLINLGSWESLLVAASFLRTRVTPRPREETFEQWVVNRFGRRLYLTFFKSYTEKVWGLPCSSLGAELAAQRIKGLSLRSVLSQALFRTDSSKSLIRHFHYPVLGPGILWQRMLDRVRRGGGRVRFKADVVRFHHDHGQIRNVWVKNGDRREVVSSRAFISTMPLSELISRLDPPPPVLVREAARRLRHRAFILVGLILSRKSIFPDQWIYIHAPKFQVGRVQNYKNWSPSMAADQAKTSLGMEYFCTQGDETWRLSDRTLVELASRELAGLGLARSEDVEDGVVFRQRFAYPVYDREYKTHLKVIRRYLSQFRNFQTIGRNGLHSYIDQDHSTFTALRAVDNLFGASHDLWNLADDGDYPE